MSKFIEAILILAGMIIGVGMFAIPISFVSVGFWLGAAELFAISGLVVWLHLLYGDVVLKTNALHRLPGYVRSHLGRRAAWIAWATAFFGITGSLLAYIAVGATFLHSIFQNIWGWPSESMWAFAVAAIGAIVTLFPLRREAFVNGILTAVLIIFIIGLVFFLFPHVDRENFSGFTAENIFVPYGVFLFAMAGGVVVPEVITVLGRNRQRARLAIIIGTLIPAALYFLFAYAVVGSLGNAVSEEAIQSLRFISGDGIVLFGSIIGFLAVFTSFVVLSSGFQALLKLDFGLHSLLAWFIASSLPLLFYILGVQSFLIVIGAVGAVAVGIDSAFIIAMQHRLHRIGGGSFHWLSDVFRIAILILILAGVIFEMFKLL